MRCAWRRIFAKSSYFRATEPICSKFANSNFKNVTCGFTTRYMPITIQNNGTAIHNLSKKHFSSITDTTNDQPPSSKLFRETENESFHRYMCNNPNYQKTVHNYVKTTEEIISKEEFDEIISVENWDDKPSDEFHTCFLKAGHYASTVLNLPISNSMFTALSSGFKKHCEKFSHKQIIDVFECLHFWPETEGVRANNFQKVYQSLDYVCNTRRIEWDINTKLHIIDLWFGLRLTRLSLYVQKCLDRIIHKCKRLTEHNLVQVYFYLSTIRTLPPNAPLCNLEYEVENVFERLSIPEIGVIASGYFKTQRRITSKTLLNKIILRVLENHDQVDLNSLASILKLVRYTTRAESLPLILDLIDKFVPKMDQYTLQTNLHLLLLCIDQNIDHYECASKFMKCMLAEPRAARLKEMENIALAIAKFKYKSELANQAAQTILSEMKAPERIEESTLHGRSFIRCVSNLATAGFYDSQLISAVLDEEFLTKNYKSKYVMELEVASLDQTVELEIHDYNGNRLDSKIKDFVCKRSSLVDIDLKYRVKPESRIVLEIMTAIAETFNQPNKHIAKYILPHYTRPDIILNVGNDLKLNTIPQEIIDQTDFTGIIRCPSGLRLCALVSGTRNMLTYGTNQLLGLYENKLRQLTNIGYLPVLIPYHEWKTLTYRNEKIDYIFKKIEVAMKEDASSLNIENVCEREL